MHTILYLYSDLVWTTRGMKDENMKSQLIDFWFILICLPHQITSGTREHQTSN